MEARPNGSFLLLGGWRVARLRVLLCPLRGRLYRLLHRLHRSRHHLSFHLPDFVDAPGPPRCDVRHPRVDGRRRWPFGKNVLVRALRSRLGRRTWRRPRWSRIRRHLQCLLGVMDREREQVPGRGGHGVVLRRALGGGVRGLVCGLRRRRNSLVHGLHQPGIRVYVLPDQGHRSFVSLASHLRVVNLHSSAVLFVHHCLVL